MWEFMVQTDARRDWKNGEDLDSGELSGSLAIRRVSISASIFGTLVLSNGAFMHFVSTFWYFLAETLTENSVGG